MNEIYHKYLSCRETFILQSFDKWKYTIQSLFKSMDWFIYIKLCQTYLSQVLRLSVIIIKHIFGIQYIDQHVIDLVIHFQLVYLLIL